MIKLLAAAGVAAISLFPNQATATTLTFDQFGFGPLVEQGYSYTNSSSYSTAGALSLHDDLGGQQQASFAKVNGGHFNAMSVDMTGFGNVFKTGTQAGLDDVNNRLGNYTDWVYDTQLNLPNFSWTGFRGGQQVAYDQGSVLNWFNMGTYTFSAAFQNLDTLVLNLLMPNVGYQVVNFTWGLTPDTVFCLAYCGSIAIDNLTLQDVQPTVAPLPAGVVLLGSGLLLMGWMRRRQTA